MFGDMMGKLQEMKQKMDQIKNRLDTITVDGQSGNGTVQVTITGNRKVKTVKLAENILSKDVEEIEDLLVIAFNKAIENADRVNEAEMQSAAAGILPNM